MSKRFITELMDGAVTDHVDDARLGLVKEMLQVVMGLEPETLDRVMRLIVGSEDAQDIKTPEMRQRIGPRAMRYLRNAIDLAREEGTEYHNEDPDVDVSKSADIEPGHKHEHKMGGERDMAENFTFKDFLLNEVRVSVDTEDPDALTSVKRDLGKSPEQIARDKQAKVRTDIQVAQTPEEKAIAMNRKKLIDQETRYDRAQQQKAKQQNAQVG